MNYSYIMGIDNIDKIKENNFEIKSFGNDYGVAFSDEKIELYYKETYYNKDDGF